MSKKKWLLFIIIIAVIGYLLLSKLYPALGTAIDSALGPVVGNFANGIFLMVTTNPTWIAYDIYFTLAAGVIIASLFWWQGHNAYNAIRQTAARSAVKEAYGYQVAPAAQPTQIPQQQTQPQVVQQPTQVQQPQEQEQPKQ